MNTSLYQLSTEYEEAAHKMLDAGYDDQTIADTLEGLSGDFNEKAESVAKFIRNLEAASAARSAEAKRLTDEAKAIDKKIDGIKQYLLTSMQRTGIEKVSGQLFVISLQNNPASVHVTDESLIPHDYWKQPEPPPPSLDKNLIKQAIKDGHTVPGVELKQSQRVSIK